ncbi:ExbD/TolR family protein [Winogradskyella jejuensis]|uniref:Biopolymer transport protein ExbD n=1 Tax=Winogradskyella jejuensis TaxID=1089305 RepID=A0A1M5UEJ4_9FLAO|nr:biopolymer transporter ExbD [Winogradskyella jejuensis]SHH61475.1 Biopolymer transport protein ExbD [Winogradskyella jejuensis]
MRNLRRNAPTVNAGSMADIAFLLLIFFLVTTTISADKGILRKLPNKCVEPPCDITINDRNILKVFVNKENKIMIEDDAIIELSELKDILINFIDNNGEKTCDYCNGKQLLTSSDKPSEAIISLKHDAQTNYGMFISVQDEVSKAYLELRTAYAKSVFNKTPEELSKDELEQVKKAYPFILSEVKVERN